MTAPPPEMPSTRRVRALQRMWAVMVRAAAKGENWLDTATWRVRERFSKIGPLQIATYRGFGTREHVVVRGRILEDPEPRASLPEDTAFTNLRQMIRRFNSHEVPHAKVRAKLGHSIIEGITDEEGYFRLWLAPTVLPHGEDDWYTAEVELCASALRGFPSLHAQAEVLVPSRRAEFGIISDIDDTVLQTHVTRRLKMLWVTFVGNAFTRLPFEETTDFYQALAVGAKGDAQNPFFYISKSPWNLYDFLIAFMDRHELPRGPLFLRDIGLRHEAPLDFKTSTIEQVLNTYPNLPFVLIGDSGERDPDIYLDIAARHPGRIRAIYIREVNENPLRRSELKAMPEQALKLGCEMLLVSHAREALVHARRIGLAFDNRVIPPDAPTDSKATIQ